MYKAIYKLQADCLDDSNQELFTPFINCYQIHSVIAYVNGVAQEQDVDFNFLAHHTKWISRDFALSQHQDSIIFDINYFYIRQEDPELLGFLVNTSYTDPAKTKEIISKHYIEGQFSLDNGLYKNAALNFGTTLEGILNKTLQNVQLYDLILAYNGNADKANMHFIRELRNRVHTNRISANQDVSRREAVEARNKLEAILNKI